MGVAARARAGLVLATVAVALAAGVPGASTAPGRPAPVPAPEATRAAVAPHDPRAAAALVAAWERSLAGTFTVESTTERRLRDGRRTSSRHVLAQRPPDRLLRQGGAVTGRLGGRLVACTATGDTVVGCTDRGQAPPWADEVAGELGTVRDLVGGPAPRYAVTTDRDGCFRLRLRVWSPAPTWGTAARFCFDPATGAPVLAEVTRPEGVDRTVTAEVRPVRAGDLALPG